MYHNTTRDTPTIPRLGDRSWYSSNGITCPIDFKFRFGLIEPFSVADNGFLGRNIFPRLDEFNGFGMAYLNCGQEGKGRVWVGSFRSSTLE